MSSRPDTSATRRGPVRLGVPPPTEPQVATAGTPGSATTGLVVQPVGDASLNSGKPVDAKPDAASTPTDPTTNKEASAAPATSGDPAAPPVPKKKKKSLFKKIIKPF